MPAYMYRVQENDVLYSSRTLIFDLAENEYVESTMLTSLASEENKGKYLVKAESYGEISVNLIARVTHNETDTDYYIPISSLNRSESSSSDINYEFFKEKSLSSTEKLETRGAKILVSISETDWNGARPSSLTSFVFRINTAYASTLTIGNSDYGTAIANYQGYVPQGFAVQLTPVPDSGYYLLYWNSSPYVEIINDSFIMPNYDITITPVFNITAGYYNGSTYLSCIPMYYNGSNWIECEWKYYDGTNWLNADST